jgi:hypothetical protein
MFLILVTIITEHLISDMYERFSSICGSNHTPKVNITKFAVEDHHGILTKIRDCSYVIGAIRGNVLDYHS